MARKAEQLGEEAAHRVRHEHAGEHERVARVGTELLELRLQALVGKRIARAVELAHLVDDNAVEVGKQVRNRRVHRDLAELLDVLALGARGKQALGENVGVALTFRAVRGQHDLAMLFEVHQPVREAADCRR